MAHQYETIDVKISRRTLWVGSQVYPLQNVTRIRSLEEVMDRGSVTWSFAKAVAKTLGGGLLALILVACAEPTRIWPQVLILAVTVAVVAWQTYRFVQELLRAKLYFLVIEAAGNAQTAVASPNRAAIGELADKITEAIDNPALNYDVKIDVVQGDQINQMGMTNSILR